MTQLSPSPFEAQVQNEWTSALFGQLCSQPRKAQPMNAQTGVAPRHHLLFRVFGCWRGFDINVVARNPKP